MFLDAGGAGASSVGYYKPPLQVRLCGLTPAPMKVAYVSQQYAALPWRKAPGLEILLITSRETRRWVIPKGRPMPGHSAAESAAQEAYEEAGIRGEMTAQAMGHYTYNKRQRGGAKKRFHVDVFAMEVTEVLDLWPEAHEHARQWLPPQEALDLVEEPELAALIRTFAGEHLGQALPAPTYSQAIWQKLKALLRLLGLRRAETTELLLSSGVVVLTIKESSHECTDIHHHSAVAYDLCGAIRYRRGCRAFGADAQRTGQVPAASRHCGKFCTWADHRMVHGAADAGALLEGPRQSGR
jgi:8-oxo-dGTP pyrophosphatase MutT (NUDIX family)